MIKLFLILFIFFLNSCSNIDNNFLYKKKPANYSYISGDVDASYPSQESMSDIYLNVASCQKVITALVSLKTLGKNFYYETKLYSSQNKDNKRDLIISFSGDPNLSSESLESLLLPVKNSNNNSKIFIDISSFQTPIHSPNIILGDVGSKYAQPVLSANIDRNLINISIKNKSGNVSIDNDLGYKIKNLIKISTEPTEIKTLFNQDEIEIYGNLNKKDKSLNLQISPKEIDFYLSQKIKSLLNKMEISGKIEIVRNADKLPNNIDLVNSIKSQMLSEFIIPALKKSDNLVFDALYLKIIHSNNDKKPIIEWDDGNKIMHQLIKKNLDVDVEKAVIVDGSGLSRYNKIQPKKLFEILKNGYNLESFKNALASPKEAETTLANRDGLLKTIKAKTGSMSSIACLCGYNIAENNNKAFVIVASNFSQPSYDIISVIDSFTNEYLSR